MRRLRENASLTTEIGKTGEVIVEGHAIGRLDGFTFAPDAADAGSDAKALQAAAQQVLAREIDARAEKLSAAADEQFVLTSDGTLRWTGDAVAKMIAADDALHPRLRIIADERLTGAAREKVQARLDLWLKTHVEKLLAPLFELSGAEDITGIARGIAFQLVEALGVVERSRIAAEMKDLDQPSRAILRKYGVRFGAYHIYVPALLKPAARALAALLWALKQDNVDLSALAGAQQLAGSGRTSFPLDKQLPRDAFRVLGYRQCGERAVRVDILERLADLIRPALAWRQTSPGEKPPGAFDGRSFVVTQAMTSLTGSAGEDFASILRALGYRMERRAPPPQKPVETPTQPADEAPSAATTEVPPAASGEGEMPVASPERVVPAVSAETAAEPMPAAEPQVSVSAEAETAAEPPASTEAVAETVAVDATPVASSANAEPGAEAGEAPAAVAAVAPETVPTPEAVTPAGADAAAATEAVSPAELVEVWRPAGRSDEHRARHERHRRRHQDRAKPAEQASAAASGEAEAGDQRERRRHDGRRDRNKDFRKVREAAPAEGGAVAAPGEAARETVEQRHRGRERFEGKNQEGKNFENKGRERDHERRREKFGSDRRNDRDRGDHERGGRDHGRDKASRDKRDGPSLRQYATSASPRDRDRAIDPNSPFAKLAALKEQLTANRKD